MKPDKGKNWPAVMEYAESIRDGKKVACLELRQAVERFFRDQLCRRPVLGAVLVVPAKRFKNVYRFRRADAVLGEFQLSQL